MKKLHKTLIASVAIIIATFGFSYSSYQLYQGFIATLEYADPQAPKLQTAQKCLASSKCSNYWYENYGSKQINNITLSLVIGALGLILLKRNSSGPPVKSPGGARWATPKEMEKYLEKKGQKKYGYIGLDTKGRTLKLDEEERTRHNLMGGGTGSGKSAGYNLPNILMDAKDGVSAIILDMKYPSRDSGLLIATEWYRYYKRKVFMFTPFDTHSHSLSLIGSIKTEEEAMTAAEMILPSEEGKTDEFYDGQRRLLIAGMILSLGQQKNANMGSLYELCKLSAEEMIAFFDEYPAGKKIASKPLSLDTKTLNGTLAALPEKLKLFSRPNVKKATSSEVKDNIQINLSQILVKPGLFYIGMQPDDVMTPDGQALIRLLFYQINREITRIGELNGGPMPVQLSIYLDEFPNLGKLPTIARDLATLRFRRVAFHISMQNMAQGTAVYGEEGFDAMRNSNFSQMIFFPNSLRGEEREYLMELMGEMTVTDKRKSKSRRTWWDIETKTESQGAASLPLLDWAEMTDWPRFHAVMIPSVGYPIHTYMPPIFSKEHPLNALMNEINKQNQKQLAKRFAEKAPYPQLPAPKTVAQLTSNISIEKSKMEYNSEGRNELEKEAKNNNEQPAINAKPSTQSTIPGFTIPPKPGKPPKNTKGQPGPKPSNYQPPTDPRANNKRS